MTQESGTSADNGRSLKREDLLDRIIKHLSVAGIATSTFRSIAAAVGVSTFPLVHHFGTKNDLLDAVVQEVERRQREQILSLASSARLPMEEYWRWTVANRDMLRLDMEILVRPRVRSDTQEADASAAFSDWHEHWIAELVAVGVEPEVAQIEATLLVAATAGLQLDLITTGDVDRTTRAFHKLSAESILTVRQNQLKKRIAP